MKLLIFATHPIQYQVPIYRELSKRFKIKIIYLLKQTKQGQSEAGFGVEFDWDIPLLDGYEFDYLTNKSSSPSSSAYNGILINENELNNLFKIENPGGVIIHGWFPKAMKQIINYTYKHKIPSFCRGDSTLMMPINPIKRILKEYYIRNILKKIDYFLYVGKENKKYYKHYGINEERLFPAHHCVNTPFFEHLFQKSAPLSLKTNKINVGFAGKFIPIKQPLLMVDAIYNSKYKDRIKLTLIGDGPLKSKIEQSCKDYNIDVHFTGFLNQSEIVPNGYNEIDLLILPSLSETWGLVVNEVMTGGIPCIVSNKVGCHSDLIKEGETGYVFNTSSAEELSKKIDTYIEKRNSGFDFKENVKNQINKYSLSETVKGYEKAINSVI